MKTAVAVFFLLLKILLLPAEGADPVFPGERLVYRITAMRFLSAGTAAFTVREEGGRYILEASVSSSRLFSVFFRVRNSMESILDGETMLPVRFEKIRREAAFRRHVVMEFDRDADMAVPLKDGEKPFEVPERADDYLSAFYRMRGILLEPGETAVLAAAGGSRAYDVSLEAVRREEIYLKGGMEEAVVLQVSTADLEPGGVVETGAARMLVWITDDERRIPARLEMELSFGTVVMSLVEYDEGRRPGR